MTPAYRASDGSKRSILFLNFQRQYSIAIEKLVRAISPDANNSPDLTDPLAPKFC